jgi:predicted DNA-binding transcriptional regulator AlpA
MLALVSPLVDTDDLIDARGVAEILGLAQPGNVSLYQRRYADMPRPVVNLGRGRCMLWLRPEIEHWAAEAAASGRTRPHRRASC